MKKLTSLRVKSADFIANQSLVTSTPTSKIGSMKRHSPTSSLWLAGFRLALLAFMIQWAGCHANPKTPPPPHESMPGRDINVVLNEHDETLMAISGVVGVYVGLREDGATPCLKVMVVRKTPDLVQKIPRELEGYPVVVEETGVIRPFRSK